MRGRVPVGNGLNNKCYKYIIVRVWTCGHAGMRGQADEAREHANICEHVRICGYADMSTCGHAAENELTDMRTCGGEWVCGYENMRTCRHAGMQRHENMQTYAIVRTYELADTRTLEHAGMRTCGHADMRTCGHVRQTCRHADTRTCGHVAAQAAAIHGGDLPNLRLPARGCLHQKGKT